MSYRILVIDHDPSGAERIQRPLTDAGYDVVVHSDASDAMSTFEKVRPDLAVIEALLPEKSGPALCQEIKDSPVGRATPVVLLLESDEDKQARARCLDLHGCDLLIERSIAEDELIELLEQLLRARLAQAETDEEASPDEAAQAQEPPATESGRDPSGKLIDSNGVVDALSQLDAIIDEQTEPDRADTAGDGVEEADAPLDPEKLRKAERAGDFSFLREEREEREKREESDRKAPPSPEGAAEESSASKADPGQDIADHIDALFAASAPGEPTPAEKQVLSWTFENGDTAQTDESSPRPPEAAEEGPAKRVATPAPAPQPRESKQAEGPATSIPEPVKVEPSFEIVARPEDAAEPKAAPKPEVTPSEGAAAAMQTATFAKPAARRADESQPSAGSHYRWWVVAACLSVVLIGGGLAILFLGGPADESAAVRPTAPASRLIASTDASTQPVSLEGSGETPVTAESAETIETTEQPGAAEAAPEPATAPAASRQAPTPRASSSPPPAREETAQPPARERTKIASPKATPPPADTATRTATLQQASVAPQRGTESAGSAPVVQPPKEDPATVETAVPAEPAASAPEPKPTPEPAATATTPGESAGRPEPKPSAPAETPATAAPPPEPAEPVLEPPELLERLEPNYPPKSLKRASGERIVLKLLISDKGRISRVLVEHGTRFKDLEAAAVSAVLRWKYMPATEDGAAVEAWTTAEFTF